MATPSNEIVAIVWPLCRPETGGLESNTLATSQFPKVCKKHFGTEVDEVISGMLELGPG